MVLQVLIHIEGIEFLRVKSGQEHAHDQEKVNGFHTDLTLLHTLVDIVVVGAEIVGSEGRAEMCVVVIHDGLQLICLHRIRLKSLIHSGLGIILTGIRRIGKDGGNLDVRLQVFEDLVVFEQHRDGLYGKEGVEFAVEGRFTEVVDDEFSNGLHPDIALFIGVQLALIVFYEEAQHVFVRNGILDHILVEAFAEHFIRGDILLGILRKNGCAGEAEYLEVPEEIDNVTVTLAKVAAVALIEYHHKLLVPKVLNTLVVEVLLDGGI